MLSIMQDFRFAARLLRKSPGFTAAAVVTLAVGIGANTAIFSFIDALFLRSIRAAAPGRLVRLYAAKPGGSEGGFSYPEYRYLREHGVSWAALAAHYSYAPLNVGIAGNAREAQGGVVSQNFFSTLGVEPALGRFFRPEEDAVPGRDPVAVVSFDYWMRRLGGRPSALGESVRINGVDFRVIGIAPRGFTGAVVGTPNDIWIPAMMLRVGYRWGDALTGDSRPLAVLGRLAPGRTLDAARAELRVLSARMAAAGRQDARVITALPAVGAEAPEQREALPALRLLMAVAVFLLAIACANIAGLQLVRGAVRRKEIAIRMGLGASRPRLVRQLLAEGLLIAVPGGALGVALSLGARTALLGIYSADTEGYRRVYDLTLDARVLLFSVAVSLLTAILFGLAPALEATRPGIAGGLKAAAGWEGADRRRGRDLLVAAQIALSLSLTAAAGLLARSSARIVRGQGLDASHIALLRLRPRLMNYSPAKAQAYTREVLRRLESIPGVRSVSLAKGSGLAWRQTGTLPVRRPDQSPEPSREITAAYHEIAPGFFETTGMELRRGRDFDGRDRPGSPRVAIVSETLATRLWAGREPLGRSLVAGTQSYRVVGVFRDARLASSLESPLPFLYLPYWQEDIEPQVDSRLVVRTGGDPGALLPILRKEAAAVDPDVPVTEVMTLAGQMDGEYATLFLTSAVARGAGLAALLLAAVGLQGALAFTVARRTREIGVRMALGASSRQILSLVCRQGARLVAFGLGAGALIAVALTRSMASLLYGVTPVDPPSLFAASLLLAAVAAAAIFLPARQAARVHPMAALREE